MTNVNPARRFSRS